ncbi:MAG: hypothetical protein JRI87_10825 [Deltaproteobacteria bacterium]|nr:hypothetical protein [Deltaproteobacteria bacterium]MBW1853608.1 hypothetical protein [Deltaproteobacteria bacterium]MCK5256825.1 hypothetical protein [Deltaproteobacteria bacterium]
MRNCIENVILSSIIVLVVLFRVNLFEGFVFNSSQALSLNIFCNQVGRSNGPVSINKVLVKIGCLDRITPVKKDEC